jgi:RNA polymerase sigma-70 factor (ECF subfamily)
MEGFTDEEAAEITGLRPGTVRGRLHRARLFVRKELATISDTPEKNVTERPHASTQISARTGRCRQIFAGLSKYLDRELDEFSCEEIKAHLNGCEPCKKFLRSLEATIERCRQSPVDCPDREKAATLRKQVLSIYSRALATNNK